MRQWIRNSLQRKLTVLMLISTLIPLLFLGLFSFNTSSQVMEQNINQSGMDTLSQMEGNLQFQMRDIENISLFLIGLRDIQQFAAGSGENNELRTRVLGMLTNLVSSKTYISDITIYSNRFDSSLSTATLYKSDLHRLVDIDRVTEKMWTSLYSVEDYAGEHHVVSFIRPLRSINTYKPLGWILISLDEQVISRHWKEVQLGGGQGEVVLVDGQGLVLSSTNREWLSKPLDSLYPGLKQELDQSAPQKGMRTYGEGEGKKTILYTRDSLAGWTLAGVFPYELYRTQSRYILQLTELAVGLSVLINALLILFIVRRITNPLRLLTRLLSKVNPDEPMPVYQTRSKDEIGQLAQSYSMLGTHIEQLKKKLIRHEARKKEADLRALQAQINPHFLYNTLSSVHWMALMADEKKIADMVGGLSDFLRFSLNKGNEFCEVHQEISHIKNYVTVQSIRFPDKFNVEYVIQPELQDKYMLKLLLQPLVENAMIHGILKKEGTGNITVCIERKGNRMNLMVLDDGIGMTEERLEFVRQSLQPGESGESPTEVYGLRNVNERLLLHYGPDSQLHIESRLHAGTRISFSIPILTEAQHENHDRG
ncbi:cache domain-containing sensor histidine kinase [Cohnella laeviribosi]|jgi:two-component system sensor histidine kinase YesM|uniref:cache domain-containing sensor histidine kinase n=1 Tax=Cohnella laeviribosi TaxID=380174 RepID=UPI003D1F9292